MKTFDLSILRDSRDINRLRSVETGMFTHPDWYRMVAAVEESNARFEAFYLRGLTGRPRTILRFPVFYTDEVQEGEAFGGMWSLVDKDGKPTHHAAFVRLEVS